jgi:Predicted metal-binding integral membrane protein (DUF2182)
MVGRTSDGAQEWRMVRRLLLGTDGILFALGIMSPIWMAVVAGLIAVEKILPSRRLATYGVTIVLLVLGVLVIVAPEAIPALTVPMQSMR